MTDSSSSLPDPFWTPPTDAVLQPPVFPPPPDPVLAPPWLPPPWDQPRPPPAAPEPESPAAAPPATPRRRTRAGSAPSPVRQAPVRQPPVLQPGRGAPDRGRRRSRRGLWIGIPILLAVCGPMLSTVARSVTDAIRDATAHPTTNSVPVEPITPSLGYPAPSAVVDGEQAGAFGLALGTGVRVTEGANQWTLAVVDVAWLPRPCSGTPSDGGPVVVLALRYDVAAGQLSSVPPVEFRYRDSAGTQHTASRNSGCDLRPAGLPVIAAAGETRNAVVAFEVPDGRGGAVTYAPSLVDVGSWAVPARPA